MIKTEELVNSFMIFGRRDMLDFVARSKDVSDVVIYLQLELGFEIDRIMSFVTTDSVTFERKKAFEYPLHQAKTQTHQLMTLDSLFGRNHLEES